MQVKRSNLTALALAGLFSLAASASSKADDCARLQDENLPKDWHPVVSFYGVGEQSGSGLFFAEIKAGGITRLIAAFDRVDSSEKKHFYCTKYFEPGDLGSWQKVWSVDGHDVVLMRSSNLSDAGGTIELKLLSNGATVFGSSYNDKLSFELSLAGETPIAKRKQKWFNVIALHARMAKVPFYGLKKVGIEQVSLCRYSCSGSGWLKSLEFPL